MTTSKQPARSEVPEKLTWKLTDLYDSDAEMKKALAQTEKQAQALQRLKGKLGQDNGQVLLQAMQ